MAFNAGRSLGECGQNPVSELDLSGDAELSVAEHELMQLIFSPLTEPTVSSGQVVEHEELAWLDAHQ
jgi:hypothetical protein